MFTCSSASSSTNTAVIGGSVGGGAFIILLVVALIISFNRRRRYQAASLRPVDFTSYVNHEVIGLVLSGAKPCIPREIKRSKIDILSVIGKGHFGEVSKATLSESSSVTEPHFVAVKILHESQAGEQSNRAAILGEAALMAQFHHPNVVNLIGVVTIGEPLLVVIELCELGSLEAFLAANEVPYSQKKQFALDCARGMAYLSKLRFIHRDLASRNVLLDASHACKIADFGMSRATIDKDYYRSRGGPLPVRWTAPESLEYQKFSEQSDVWSFGVLLWEIWSHADMPYEGWNNDKVWSKVVAGYKLDCPIGCPSEIYYIMLSCWADEGLRPVFLSLVQIIETTGADATHPSRVLYLKPDEHRKSVEVIAHDHKDFSNDENEVELKSIITEKLRAHEDSIESNTIQFTSTSHKNLDDHANNVLQGTVERRSIEINIASNSSDEQTHAETEFPAVTLEIVPNQYEVALDLQDDTDWA